MADLIEMKPSELLSDEQKALIAKGAAERFAAQQAQEAPKTENVRVTAKFYRTEEDAAPASEVMELTRQQGAPDIHGIAYVWQQLMKAGSRSELIDGVYVFRPLSAFAKITLEMSPVVSVTL